MKDELEKTLRVVAAGIDTLKELDVYGQRWVDKMLEDGIIEPGIKVLDYGAGLGRLSIPMQKAGILVTAVDRRRDMRDYLVKNDIRTFLAEDLKKIEGEYFDMAIAMYVFQHMSRDVAREIIRQIANVTHLLYFTIPTVSMFPDGFGKTYRREAEEKGGAIYGESERSMVYQDETLYEDLIKPYFNKITPVKFKNAGMWKATNG